ncbi:major facilitator superfamily domain-containing protein 6-like protein B [Ptychodera flava]|uniref:major facilitator superfamily domain-containing protein 6-like protein B n=1 Tax=Ptychodera flava TaxID=63121 RepID=UPI00396A4AB7
MMAKQEQVNLTKSLATANIFYFIYNSGKVCLLPFLTLYFRQLGLSATQTGIIFATKAFVAFLVTPLWSKFARRFDKYRVIIIGSLFAINASHLALMLVPPVHEDSLVTWCSNVSNATFSYLDSQLAGSSGVIASNLQAVPNKLPEKITTNAPKFLGNVWNGASASPYSETNWIGQGKLSHENGKWETDSTESNDDSYSGSKIPSLPILTDSSTEARRNKVHHGNAKMEDDERNQIETNTLMKNYRDIGKRSVSTEEVGDLLKIPTEVFTFLPERSDQLEDIDFYQKSMLKGLYQSDSNRPMNLEPERTTQNYFYKWLKDHSKEMLSVLSDKRLDPQLGNIRRRSVDEAKENKNIKSGDGESEEVTYKVFIAVLLLCIVGEVVSSPFERLLDDTFFGFLDDMDYIEKYGRQKLWSLLGYGLWGVTICIIVDNTPCLLNFNINRFMIHFYGFAALIGLALLVVLFFPVQQTPSKDHSRNKLLKCFKLIYSDSHTIAYVISMFMTGLINATKLVFLFWLVMDLNGSETAMGLAITVCSLSQVPMQHLQSWFTKHLTQVGVMTISLATLAIQYLYYSFLWTPWAVVPIEILSMFSVAGVLSLSMTYAEITAPPGLDRMMQLIFWTLYWQVGFAIGSITGGFVYGYLSPQALFRSVSLLALLWAVTFLIIMKYAPRSKRRLSYSKLLQNSNDMDDDDDEDSDDEYTRDVYSGDWLVNALKQDLD